MVTSNPRNPAHAVTLVFLLAAALLLMSGDNPATAAPPTGWDHDHIATGWDWSLPAGIAPAERSGVVCSRLTQKLPGHRLVHVASTWRELEPHEGEYVFDALKRKIEQAAAGCDGVLLSVYGSVDEMRRFTDRTCTQVAEARPGAVPEWVMSRYHVGTVAAPPKPDAPRPFQLVNADVCNADFDRCYVRFVAALGRSGIPKMPQVKYAYLHEVSPSQGEESGLRDTGREGEVARQRIDAWADAFAGVEYKLAYVGSRGANLAHAFSRGAGQRGGFIEAYYLNLDNPQLGQSVDPQGYLITDESLPAIAEHRAFGEENEEYGESWVHRWGPIETQPLRYRESMLRALEMRRNYIWNAAVPTDPPLLDWVSLELGRDVTDAPDAWCELRQSELAQRKARSRPVKNFERWLYQRDIHGVTTEPAIPFARMEPHAKKRGAHPPTEYAARRGPRIGFAVDDRFFLGGPHRVAVKVTFHDLEDAGFSLVYHTPAGESRRPVAVGHTGEVRTATFILNNAVFDARGTDFDFELDADGKTEPTISFVRVVKLENPR